ncbi:MAG: type II toxin-antitoxin system RelE/ParE family toxin [Nitrospirae bacterium]|nr:type II toxin-antitoxin system RelE/ParE family toxin [Nitrospirota bacterium]
MGFAVLFHPDLYEDLKPLNQNIQETILSAMENRLGAEPMKYGKRLSRGLRGFWKLRVGQYRVIYRVEGTEVWVLKVGHRKDVYAAVKKRLGWTPRIGD